MVSITCFTCILKVMYLAGSCLKVLNFDDIYVDIRIKSGIARLDQVCLCLGRLLLVVVTYSKVR